MHDLPQHLSSLLIGYEHGDDAAVLQLREDLALVQSLDFFMPIVDDPFHFGQIAACNSLSDIYAMGATPIMALAILGFPIKKLGTEVANRIMKGGASICAQAKIPLAGGHSIDDNEPKFGLSVSGTVHPNAIWSNGGAQPGDHLILTKSLGIGIMGSAIKKGALSTKGYDQFLESTTTLNDGAARAGKKHIIHAATDITGFGLLGHAVEIARASSCTIELHSDKIPIYDEARALLKKGIKPGATARNISFAQPYLESHELSDEMMFLLGDPQTSGGLLLSVPSHEVQGLIYSLSQENTLFAVDIGQVKEGPAKLVLRS